VAGSLEVRGCFPLAATVEAINKSLESYDARSSFKQEDLTRAWTTLTWENYFMIHNSSQQTPLQFIWNAEVVKHAFLAVTENPRNKDHRLRLQAYAGKKNPDDHWKKFLENFESKLRETKYIPPTARVGNAGNYEWMNLRLAWIVALLHLTVFDLDKFNSVPRIFKRPEPESKQVKASNQYRMFHKTFTGFDWIQHYLFVVHRELVRHVNARVDYEHWLVTKLQKANVRDGKNQQFKAKMINDGTNFDYNLSLWDAVTGTESKCIAWYENKTDKAEKKKPEKGAEKDEKKEEAENEDTEKAEKDSAKNKIYPSSLRDRLKCLATNVLLADMIDTFLEHGPDPELPPVPQDEPDLLRDFRTYIE